MSTCSHKTPQWKLIPFVLLLAVLASGCSSMAERIVARRITNQFDDTFDLDATQKKATRAAVDRVIDAAAPLLGEQVNRFVKSLDTAIKFRMNEENLLELASQLDSMGDIAASKIVDEAVPILSTLSDKQIAYGQKEILKKVNKDRKKLSKPAEARLKKRQREVIQATEKWTGRLNDSQESLLKKYVQTLPDYTALRLDASANRTRRMAMLLSAHPSEDSIRQALMNEWQAREDLGPAAPTKAERRARSRATLIYIDRLMTPNQRLQARAYLRKQHKRLMLFLGRKDRAKT